MSDEQKPAEQPAPVPVPIVGGGASNLRQMKEEAK
jgi:hypothetical protein